MLDNNTKITVSVQTDPGCVREANEDSGLHVNPSDAGVRTTKGTLTIVADGMGGHASGEVASQMAVELISELYYSLTELPPREALRAAIEQANAEIFSASASDEKYFGMGTTVIALVLQNSEAFSAHVGDSRLYRLRNGELELLTMDHSQVMEMVKHGVISMDEARDHEDKNVILRAVGTQQQVEVELSPVFDIASGDTFLLCSDGLSDMVTDEDIHQIMAAETDVHGVSEKLIAAAKANGGHDNITAGIVHIGATEPQVSGSVRITREIQV